MNTAVRLVLAVLLTAAITGVLLHAAYGPLL